MEYSLGTELNQQSRVAVACERPFLLRAAEQGSLVFQTLIPYLAQLYDRWLVTHAQHNLFPLSRRRAYRVTNIQKEELWQRRILEPGLRDGSAQHCVAPNTDDLQVGERGPVRWQRP